MKKLLLSLCLAFTAFFSQASHVGGGEIFYRYIGDSTGTPHHYEITVKFYRTTSGIPAPMPPSVDISNSCGLNYTWDVPMTQITPNTNHPDTAWYGTADTIRDGNGNIIDTVYSDFDGGFWPDYLQRCADKSNDDFIEIATYISKGRVILDSTCADWTFSIDINARNGYIQNIQGGDFYDYALLNNVNGPNSLSKENRYLNTIYLCKDQYINIQTYNKDPNGDSVHYSFADALEGPGNISPWEPGYSRDVQFQSLNGMELDSTTGEVSFTSIQAEVGILIVKATEYRYSNTLGQWLMVGESTTNATVVISDYDCSEELTKWSMNPVDTATVSCGDSVFTITSDTYFNSETVSASDFRLLDPDSIPNPVLDVEVNSIDGYSNQVTLYLYNPLDVEGDYTFIIKSGNDGNSIYNACGFSLEVTDTISNYAVSYFTIANCPTPIDTSGNDTISVDTYEVARIKVYPNPAQEQLNIAVDQKLIGETHFNVYNTSGVLLKSINRKLKALENFSIDVSDLPKGVYILQFTQANGYKGQHKFIKK